MKALSKEWAESKLPNEDGQEIGAGCPASVLFALGDTRIEVAGVLRCCLATVAEEYQGEDGPEGDQQVTIGMKSQCRHCKQPFTLVAASPHPKWKPDWQLGANDQAVQPRERQ